MLAVLAQDAPQAAVSDLMTDEQYRGYYGHGHYGYPSYGHGYYGGYRGYGGYYGGYPGYGYGYYS